ncbi:MAG: TetR/AcrR family transcriptional regulator [Chloroflexi bacterium]|nr:TetR/AcrR family transcriptional regulator [Chloroflexota bacterium]
MPRRYVMVRRAQLTRETRRRIIGAVLDLVLERGPEDFSVEEICERAKVSLRTVYYHFPSRAALLSAALVELAREMGAAALRAWRDDQADPCEALLGYVAGIYQVYEEEAPRFEAILSVRRNPELEATVGRLRAAARDHMTVLLEAARPQLRLPLTDAIALAYMQTLYPVWRSYRVDLGWSTAEAIAFVTRFLRETLFQPNAPPTAG